MSPLGVLGTEACSEWRKAHWKVKIRASTWRSEKRHKLSSRHSQTFAMPGKLVGGCWVHENYQNYGNTKIRPFILHLSRIHSKCVLWQWQKVHTYTVLLNKVDYFWPPNYEWRRNISSRSGGLCITVCHVQYIFKVQRRPLKVQLTDRDQSTQSDFVSTPRGHPARLSSHNPNLTWLMI